MARRPVAAGRIHYLVVGDERAARNSAAERIVQWATSTFPWIRLGHWQLVDLTAADGVG